MSIGFGIFLFAVGAILAFAVNLSVEGVNLIMVGYIFMVAGAVTTVIGIVLMARRRSETHETVVDPVSGERTSRRSSSAPLD